MSFIVKHTQAPYCQMAPVGRQDATTDPNSITQRVVMP